MIHQAGHDLMLLLVSYGYWAVLVIVGMESLGLPLPGETTLVAAAIYAGASHRPLHRPGHPGRDPGEPSSATTSATRSGTGGATASWSASVTLSGSTSQTLVSPDRAYGLAAVLLA